MTNDQLERIELLLTNKGKIYAALACVEAGASWRQLAPAGAS